MRRPARTTSSRRATRGVPFDWTIAVAASALVLVFGLAAGSARAGAAAVPPRDPPVTKGVAGPPAAWIETAAGRSWLAFSTFCWKTACVDYLPPRSRTDLPLVRVKSATTAVIHFAFAARQVDATTFVGTTLKHEKLPPGRSVAWRPRWSGVVSFGVRGPAGSASYVLRVRVG